MVTGAADSRDDAALLRRVLDLSRSTTVLVDNSGRVVYASAAIRDLVGVSAQEAVGVSILEWLRPDDVERAVSSLAMNAPVEGVRYFPMVFHLRHADGHEVEVDVLTSNVVDDGEMSGVLLSARHADDRTHFVEPIRALAAGADHGRVLEMIASGVGRGGSTLRPAMIAAAADPTDPRFTQIHSARVEPDLLDAVAEYLASPAAEPLSELFPRELRALPLEDLPEDLQRVLEDHDSAGLRAGAIGIGATVTALLISVEPRRVWNSGIWSPSLRDHWLQLLDLATVAFERHRVQNLLLHAATHDSLTGLANRAHFFQQLGRLATRDDVAVLYLDLDGFKTVNDSYGHFCGDAVLVEVAHRMRNALRPGDLVGRFGGDEFAIAVIDRPSSVLAELAERLHGTIVAPLPPELGPPSIGVSIGIARLRVGQTVDELVHQADQALLTAKRAGRNTVMEHIDT